MKNKTLMLAWFILALFILSCNPEKEETKELPQHLQTITTTGDLNISVGQMVYVPAYSQIHSVYSGGKGQMINFAVTLSIRKTDLQFPIIIKSVSYYDNDGTLLKEYVEMPFQLSKIVLGMGRTGTEVYNVLKNKYKQMVLGIDSSMSTVENHLSDDLNVIHGDITDIEFWQRISPDSGIQFLILATSNHSTHMQVINGLEKMNKKIMVASLSRYNDEMEELKQAGVEVVFNLYAEAGLGYAEHIFQNLNQSVYNEK